MAAGLLKHFNEQDKRHGTGRLFWSENSGLPVPFRGAFAPTLTQEEIQSQVKITGDFKWRQFDLSKPEDGKDYEWVMDRICSGWFQKVHIERIVEQGHVMVYLEWIQRYAELSPTQKAARRQGNVYTVEHAQPAVPLAGRQGAGY